MPRRQATPMDAAMRIAAACMNLGLAQAMMGMAAAEVMSRRMMMMGTGAMSGPEAARMMMEKPIAFGKAAQDGAMAAMRGGDALRVASAALRPIRREAEDNARRLRR